MKMFSDMDKGILCSADMKQFKYKLLYFLMIISIFIYCLVVFLPSFWLILSGFKAPGEMFAKPTRFFPRHMNLSKIYSAWMQMKFYRYYINTFIMAGGSVIADVMVSGLAGYVLSKLKPRGSKVFYVLVFCLMLMPTTMSTVPIYMTFINFPYFHVNLLNTYWPIWIMAATNMFHIILFKTSFDAVSNSLVEAAKIDGASNMRIFFNVMLPLSVPVIVTASLFTFNIQFGNFFWPYILISDESKTVLGVQLYKVKNSTLTMDYQMLTVLFAIIPQLTIFAAFQKYIMGGINIGGVKG